MRQLQERNGDRNAVADRGQERERKAMTWIVRDGCDIGEEGARGSCNYDIRKERGYLTNTN